MYDLNVQMSRQAGRLLLDDAETGHALSRRHAPPDSIKTDDVKDFI